MCVVCECVCVAFLQVLFSAGSMKTEIIALPCSMILPRIPLSCVIFHLAFDANLEISIENSYSQFVLIVLTFNFSTIFALALTIK